MDYEEFKEYVRQQAIESLGGEAKVEIRRCVKNNGILLDGLSVFEKGTNISPNIYLESYYEKYRRGEDPKELVEQVLESYRRSRLDCEIPVDFMRDFEKAKPAIRRKLVNREKNGELLKSLPFDEYLDLAVIWYLDVPDDIFPNSTVLVRLEELKRWGVSKDEVREAAELNMRELRPISISPIVTVISSLYEELLKQPDERPCPILRKDECAPHPPMYVMTTRDNTYGAAAMLDVEKIRCLAEVYGRDIYILPSSVHEVILVPENEKLERGFMSEMIRDINRREVAPSEVLSDTLYRFDRASGQVVIDIKGE